MSKRLIALWIMLPVLLLSACGAKPSAPATPTPAPAPAPAPKSGGTLTIAVDTEPNNLDPGQASGWQAGRLLRDVYDRLIDIDYDLKTFKPALATSWKSTDDGLTWTFQLRKDVKFHNGDPLTADDVAYTFNRKLDPKFASPTRGDLGPLEKAEAVDPSTVRFTLKEPYAPFLAAMASIFSSIVDKKFTEQAGKDYGVQVMNGTGPFKFTEWKRGERNVFDRFNDYKWGSALYQNAGPAKLDKLIIRPIKDAAARVLSIKNGDVDILAPLAIPLNQAKDLGKDVNIKLEVFDTLQIHYMVYNVSKPVMEEAVRKAINMAINKQQVVDSLLYGYAALANSMLVPGTLGAPADAKPLAYAFDTKQAEQLLDQAGWKKGTDGVRARGGTRLELNMVVPATSYYPDVAQMVQGYLDPIGIKVKVSAIDIGQFWGQAQDGNYDMSFYGNSWADPHEVIYRYFYSKNIPAPGYQRVNDPALDADLKKAAQISDPAQRQQLYADAVTIMAKNAYTGPLFHAQGVMAVRKSVQGFKPYGDYNAGWNGLLDVSNAK